MKSIAMVLLMLAMLCLFAAEIALAELPGLQGKLEAFDLPSDDGSAIGLSWPVAPTDAQPGWEYVIYRGPTPGGPFEEFMRFPSGRNLKSDAPKYFGFSEELKAEHFVEIEVEKEDGRQVPYYYKLVLSDDTQEVVYEPAVTAIARPNWIAWNKLNNFILMVLLCGFVLFFIQWAKRNPNLFIRKIAGLDALDEAVGRATEMGKPIMYTTGYHDMDRVSTIASVNILEHVAKKVAQYDTRMIVPCKWSIAMTVCQEVVKEAYTNAGRPDAYNAHDIFFVAGEQFSWTAAVDGIIMRERPAANFLLGTFAAEALILAETGAATGAIQISGTDSPYQIPFFVVACDYCLIGEELYAASAYLSREPRLLGSLKGQDVGKLLLMAGLVLGNITLLLYELGLKTPIMLWVKHFFTQI